MSDTTIPRPPLPAKAITFTGMQSTLWAFIAEAESEVLSLDPKDRGNWTSGIIGIGELRGSKYGVSAAAFPTTDIAAVTYDSAMTICMGHYWPAVQADLLTNSFKSPALAMMMVDAAWNSGPTEAIELLQRAIGGVVVDGDFGPKTRTGLARAMAAPPRWHLSSSEVELLANYSAERILFDSKSPQWLDDRNGWTHRIMRLHALSQLFLGGLDVGRTVS